MMMVRSLLTPFLISLIASLRLVTPAIGQDLSGVTASATASVIPPPQYDIEATSKILEETITQLDPFTYSVELFWEGAQQWISLDSPEIDWPEGIRQLFI